jgi:hypothetical protein
MRYHPEMDKAGNSSIRVVAGRGHKTPDIVRDEAFRLWLNYGRSWTAVARLIDCDESTLRRWGKADNWEARRLTELANALPGMRQEADVSREIASYEASIRLQQIAHDAAHNGIPPSVKEVDALTRIVDRRPMSPSIASTDHHAHSDRPHTPSESGADPPSSPAHIRSSLIEAERERRRQRQRQD